MKNLLKKNRVFQRLATLVIVFYTLSIPVWSQAPAGEAAAVKSFYDQALRDSRCYAWLEHLCYQVGHRLSGSVGAERAVAYTKSMLDTLGLDSVWLQPVMVPRWERGAAERVEIKAHKLKLDALALGGSVAGDVRAEVVEVLSWEQLESLGERQLRGKIVFYNRPMDPTRIRTFEAYGGAVDQRVHGASRAAKYGAVGVLVRSMGLRADDYPHTGTLRYDSAYTLIPAAAISTNSADRLSQLLKTEKKVVADLQLHCASYPDVLSYNVIGEIRGSEKPNDIILVGGHLDSWDVGHGAHDDGAGCVQSMEVLRIFRQMNYRPRHTIRCVLFMNEENGLRGGQEYANEANRKGEFHLLAIESDAGGFTPRGFGFDGDPAIADKFFASVEAHRELFEPYGLTLSKGGGGADISPLKSQKGLLSGYIPDSQRYFDYHHTAADTFDTVNRRELELGAASMAVLVYLADKFGL